MDNDKDISIIWFRQDLRIKDNPALSESLKHSIVYPIYILDDINARDHEMGAASKIWLHHSLNNLNKKVSLTINFINSIGYKSYYLLNDDLKSTDKLDDFNKCCNYVFLPN